MKTAMKIYFILSILIISSNSMKAENEKPTLIEKSLKAIAEGVEDGLDVIEEDSSLLFRLGYPYNIVQNNANFKNESYPAFFAGVELKLDINQSSFVSLTSEVSYTYNYDQMSLKLDDRNIIGDSSIRVNAFALLYYRRLNDFKIFDKTVFLSLGPAIAQTTLKFDDIEKNNTTISAKNKVTLRQYGLRASILLKRVVKSLDVELIYYYLKRNSFNVVENSSLDTNVLRTVDESSETSNHSIAIVIRKRIF